MDSAATGLLADEDQKTKEEAWIYDFEQRLLRQEDIPLWGRIANNIFAWKWLILNMTILIVNITLVVILVLNQTIRYQRLGHVSVSNFGEDEIIYETRRMHASGFEFHWAVEDKSYNLYEGPPTPEKDKAWDDLIQVGIVSLTSDEAGQLANKTLENPLVEGEYMVGVEVFHQIHCVNILRHQVYEQATPYSQRPRNERAHIDHCVDSLRQVIMCHGDTTPMSLVRDERESPPYFVIFETVHTCRNWDSIWNWAVKRNTTGLLI
ncbi:hypothetical protein F5884DRAFT_874356 [Xylogone sp. PMI_703]|nr:hypothetical protein F5884DRAFT_874356 [Xylogone sp. PMI_703]